MGIVCIMKCQGIIFFGVGVLDVNIAGDERPFWNGHGTLTPPPNFRKRHNSSCYSYVVPSRNMIDGNVVG